MSWGWEYSRLPNIYYMSTGWTTAVLADLRRISYWTESSGCQGWFPAWPSSNSIARVLAHFTPKDGLDYVVFHLIIDPE